MRTYRIFSMLLALVLMVSSFLYWPQSKAMAVSTTIVIGEVQSRGSAGAADEFVELYNLSASEVDISGYMIKYQPCTSATTLIYFTVPAITQLGPYQHYLVAGTTYDGAAPKDGSLSSGLSDCAKIQLQNSAAVAVDTLVYTYVGGSVPALGWAGMEGAYFANNPHNNGAGTNIDSSMVRKPDVICGGGGHCNQQDTDINADDFVVAIPSSPENMSSPTAITLLNLSGQNSARLPFELFGLLAGVLALGGLTFWQKRSH
jgi:hypothetical protein